MESKIEEIIVRALRKTLECKFKRTAIRHFLGKGWACVEIETFAKDLTKALKGKTK